MLRRFSLIVTIATVSAAFLAMPHAAQADGAKASRTRSKNVVTNHRAQKRWHGYGFLPGYEPLELRARRQGRYNPSYGYWYGAPRYHGGRWNGGGFGPCYAPRRRSARSGRVAEQATARRVRDIPIDPSGSGQVS